MSSRNHRLPIEAYGRNQKTGTTDFTDYTDYKKRTKKSAKSAKSAVSIFKNEEMKIILVFLLTFFKNLISFSLYTGTYETDAQYYSCFCAAKLQTG